MEDIWEDRECSPFILSLLPRKHVHGWRALLSASHLWKIFGKIENVLHSFCLYYLESMCMDGERFLFVLFLDPCNICIDKENFLK
jgi:hypothetical protein